MTEIGAKVYRLALNSSACHGDNDAHLEWLHTGEEVVRHSDYELALKRILELEAERDRLRESLYRIQKNPTWNAPAIAKHTLEDSGEHNSENT